MFDRAFWCGSGWWLRGLGLAALAAAALRVADAWVEEARAAESQEQGMQQSRKRTKAASAWASSEMPPQGNKDKTRQDKPHDKIAH